MSSFISDTTYQSDFEHLENFYNSIKSLDAEYMEGIANKTGYNKIDTDDKLRKYQTQFWEKHIHSIDLDNQECMKCIKDDGSNNTYSECCSLVWKLCSMVNLYNDMIFGDWASTDLESRKRTILIAISDISKYRCGKVLTNSVISACMNL